MVSLPQVLAFVAVLAAGVVFLTESEEREEARRRLAAAGTALVSGGSAAAMQLDLFADLVGDFFATTLFATPGFFSAVSVAGLGAALGSFSADFPLTTFLAASGLVILIGLGVSRGVGQ